MLDLRIASKSFRAGDGTRREILRDVTLRLVPGERLVLLGPSGTGKSTILRIALGLDRDYTGEVHPTAARVGVMFQEPRLLPWLDVAANLRLVCADDATPPDIPGLLAEMGLPGSAALMPRQLSLGMARRVSLARALSVRPDLLVLDEPFASLDPALAASLAQAVTRHARTMIVATHDLAHALGFATRVVILGGHPATVMADRPVSPGEADRLLAELCAAFPFLTGAPVPADQAALPSGAASA